jgi:hypothetical protein
VVPDHDVLKERPDSLSRRIEAGRRRFIERGELTPTIQTDIEGFYRRSAAISANISDAISKGDTWDLIRYELERDFSSLSQDFEQFEERLDAEEMKRRGST